MINDFEVTRIERRDNVRAEARGRAKQDVKDERLSGQEAEEFFKERMEHHFAELENSERLD